MVKDTVFKRVAELAHKRDVTVEAMLELMEKDLAPDTSAYTKNEKGETVYPDGRVSLDFDLDDDLVDVLYTKAAEEGITANDLIMKAIMAKVEQVRAENPEAFKDLA